MPLIAQKLAMLAKLETVYGTDSVPTGAANAILAREVEVTPLTIERQARDLYRPFLGNSTDVIGAFSGRLAFKVEMAGSGTAGTAPNWGPLHRACGFAQVVTAGVSTVYTPVSNSFESLSTYFNMDGVLHKFTGVRGNLGLQASYRQAPLWQYSFIGMFVPVTDLALPAVTLTGWADPLAFNFENTPGFTLHGVSGLGLREFSFDLANAVTFRNLVGSRGVRITDRKPVGSLEFSAELMAVKNWFDVVRNATGGALQLDHGTTAGNRVSISAPALQLTDAAYTDFEGEKMLRCSSKFMPVSGNDELTITVN